MVADVTGWDQVPLREWSLPGPAWFSRENKQVPGTWARQELEGLADPRSFMRGLAYQQQGRVEVEAQGSDVVTATVRGSMPYRVELRRAPRLSWSCTCPVGENGDFCKHCVAVALQVTADEPERRHPRQADASMARTWSSTCRDSRARSWSTCCWSRSNLTGGFGEAHRSSPRLRRWFAGRPLLETAHRCGVRRPRLRALRRGRRVGAGHLRGHRRPRRSRRRGARSRGRRPRRTRPPPC